MRRHDSGCRFLFALTAALLTVLVLVHRGGIGVNKDSKKWPTVRPMSQWCTRKNNGSSRLRAPISVTFTTGASSKEFLNLLHFVESFAMLKPKIGSRLVVWDLGLRACQVRFLLERFQPLGIQLQVKEFPFTLYPLYFRSIKGIWKPVAIKKVVDEFGAALWLDPELQLNKQFTDIFTAIEQKGFVATVSSSLDFRHNSICGSSIVGFQKGNDNAYNILEEWSQLTLQVMVNNCKYSSTMAKASCGDVTVNWADHTLSLLVSHCEESCQYIVSQEVHAYETPLQKYYAVLEQNNICPNASASAICILTGSQTYSDTKKFSVGSALRRNKERYAFAHGYHFIEEGRAYVERKNSGYSGPNWGKFDTILKNLDDCKLLLFVDSDAIFTNFSTKVESFFALPEVKGKDMLIVKPSSDSTINAGVLLMRNIENTHAIFLKLMDHQSWSSDWRFRFAFEQSAMWDLVGPVHSIWRRIVHVFEGDHTLQSFCGFSDGHCLWRPGDFVAHFAPPAEPAELMAKFMKEHSDIVHAEE